MSIASWEGNQKEVTTCLSCRGEGWYREQGRSLPSVHKARLPTEGGATKLLGKEREKGVLACPMPLQMLSSLLSSSSTLQQVLILQDAVLRSLP